MSGMGWRELLAALGGAADNAAVEITMRPGRFTRSHAPGIVPTNAAPAS